MVWRLNYAFLSLLVVAAPVLAKEPETYPATGVQVFLGLDDTSAPTQVQDGRAQDIQNVSLSSSKSARKRYGIKNIGGVTIDLPGEAFCAVTGLYYTKFSSGTERILETCGTRFRYLSGTTWTLPGSMWTQPFTAGQNNQFVFTTALDNVIFTNDTNAPVKWAGGASENTSGVVFTGLTNVIQKSKTVAFFKNYLIFGNTQEASIDYPTRIRWSNVGTINTWSDEDYIDIGALGGQEINAVAELYDNLYVFLTDSIYRISLVGGADTFQVSKVTDDIGCIAKNSVQSITLGNAQNGLVFLDKDKRVYFFNGVTAQDIGGLITETLDGLSGSRLQYAVSADTGSDYWLCLTNGSGSTNDLCLDFQYEIGEWTKHTNIKANAMTHVLDSNSIDQIYFGNDDSALVYQLEDSSLKNDVGGASGTFTSVSRINTANASGLQILYNTSAAYTASGLIGAPLELVGGTGSGLVGTIVDNTTTGLIVAAAFTTTPDSTTTYEVGAIDAFYTTKWYDMGQSARLKHFGEIYLWGDADISSTHSLSYATDFNSDISTQSLSMSASSSDAIWGSAIWGTSLWGSVDTIFRQAKLETQGRYLKVKYAEDDPDETFHWFGWSSVYWSGQVN